MVDILPSRLVGNTEKYHGGPYCIRSCGQDLNARLVDYIKERYPLGTDVARRVDWSECLT
jgi:hypothetical protein